MLHKWQSCFADALFAEGEAAAEVEKWLSSHGGGSHRVLPGIEAYRRSVLANLAGAIRATYPVVEAIVGKDFFAAAARRYARERPSRSGDLNAYGSDFDDFLATYEPAAGLPYLPAIASLEWQIQTVYGAEDAPPQNFALLAATPPEAWGTLGFRLSPAHAVLVSNWPLARIWAVNQPGYAGDFKVDCEVAQTVLVLRQPQGIVVESLGHGEQAFLAALSAGAPLSTAVAAAATDPTFDLPVTLQLFIVNGLLREAISHAEARER